MGKRRKRANDRSQNASSKKSGKETHEGPGAAPTPGAAELAATRRANIKFGVEIAGFIVAVGVLLAGIAAVIVTSKSTDKVVFNDHRPRLIPKISPRLGIEGVVDLPQFGCAGEWTIQVDCSIENTTESPANDVSIVVGVTPFTTPVSRDQVKQAFMPLGDMTVLPKQTIPCNGALPIDCVFLELTGPKHAEKQGTERWRLHVFATVEYSTDLDAKRHRTTTWDYWEWWNGTLHPIPSRQYAD